MDGSIDRLTFINDQQEGNLDAITAHKVNDVTAIIDWFGRCVTSHLLIDATDFHELIMQGTVGGLTPDAWRLEWYIWLFSLNYSIYITIKQCFLLGTRLKPECLAGTTTNKSIKFKYIMTVAVNRMFYDLCLPTTPGLIGGRALVEKHIFQQQQEGLRLTAASICFSSTSVSNTEVISVRRARRWVKHQWVGAPLGRENDGCVCVEVCVTRLGTLLDSGGKCDGVLSLRLSELSDCRPNKPGLLWRRRSFPLAATALSSPRRHKANILKWKRHDVAHGMQSTSENRFHENWR